MRLDPDPAELVRRQRPSIDTTHSMARIPFRGDDVMLRPIRGFFIIRPDTLTSYFIAGPIKFKWKHKQQDS